MNNLLTISIPTYNRFTYLKKCLDQLLPQVEKYKDQVRFQVRNFPITSGHRFAMQAAKNAEAAARQDKFWEMHDKLFEGQKTWEEATDPQAYFDQYAQAIGLDMDKFKADRISSDVNDVINKDLRDVQAIGGTGTPTFAVNDKKIDKTAPNLEALSQMVEDALKEAGIVPKPSTAQATNSQTMPAFGSEDLNPGASKVGDDEDRQQGQQ